jgi:hypothetical protein
MKKNILSAIALACVPMVTIANSVSIQSIFIENHKGNDLHGAALQTNFSTPLNTVMSVNMTGLKSKNSRYNRTTTQGIISKTHNVDGINFTIGTGLGCLMDSYTDDGYYVVAAKASKPFKYGSAGVYVRHRDVFSSDYKFNSQLVGFDVSLSGTKHGLKFDYAHSYGDERFTAYGISYTMKF